MMEQTKNSRILVLGAGVTGQASIEALHGNVERLGLVEDNDALAKELEQKHPGLMRETLESLQQNNPYELLLKSPGIVPTHPVVVWAENNGLPVVSDIELAYRLFPDYRMALITGTNGKTTTTSLLAHIGETGGHTVHLLGNIGVGVLPAFFAGNRDDLYVIECSSFQLANSPTLRAPVCGILNLSADHLNWHGSMESYVEAKTSPLRHQVGNDIAVLNLDDPLLRDAAEQAGGRVLPIRMEGACEGYYVDGDRCMDGTVQPAREFYSFHDFPLPGNHNRQNALVAIAMAKSLGIDEEAIRSGLTTFGGVQHRIEYIDTIRGIAYYNDSKGTNVDASIKAIEALPASIRLLAGGTDKKISYAPLFDAFGGKVSALYVYGETKEQLKDTAAEKGFQPVTVCSDLEEAVRRATEDAQSGDIVLLSPASASWDMYPNFEARGDHFRRIVESLPLQ